jgi:hypothetical protein
LALAAFITALPTGVLPVNTRWSKGSAENPAGDDGHLLLWKDLAEHFGQKLTGRGRELGRLDHRPIARRQRRGERHERQPDREIPGRHDADDAERLVDDMCAAGAELHVHMPLLRAHPALEIAAQVVDALDQRHAFENCSLPGRATLEIDIECLLELGKARPHGLLQREQIGLAGGKRGGAIAQECCALAGEDGGQTPVGRNAGTGIGDVSFDDVRFCDGGFCEGGIHD